MARNVPFNVAIVGVGLVGEQVVHQLMAEGLKDFFQIKSLHTSRRHLRVIGTESGMSSSDLVHYLKNSLPKLEHQSVSCQEYSGGVEQVVRYLSDRAQLPGPVIVIDCTSSQELADHYPLLLSSRYHQIHLVTPNKKAFSGSDYLFQDIEAASYRTKNMVFKEATVGAGLPVLSTLRDLILTGDKILKIEGVLSGTMSYIFNQFSQRSSDPVHNPQMRFSEVVKIAQSKGYTEPNPADDLDGSDVARKLSILLRHIPQADLDHDSSLQLPQGYQSVSNQPILPAKCFEIQKPQEFLSALPLYDSEFERLRAEAFQENCLLRFVGIIDLTPGAESKNRVKAGLEKYPFDHPFSSLSGSDNILAFYTRRYPVDPLIIRGAGAGAAVTAMGVVSDMIKVAERLLGHNISLQKYQEPQDYPYPGNCMLY